VCSPLALLRLLSVLSNPCLFSNSSRPLVAYPNWAYFGRRIADGKYFYLCRRLQHVLSHELLPAPVFQHFHLRPGHSPSGDCGLLDFPHSFFFPPLFFLTSDLIPLFEPRLSRDLIVPLPPCDRSLFPTQALRPNPLFFASDFPEVPFPPLFFSYFLQTAIVLPFDLGTHFSVALSPSCIFQMV